MRNEVFWGMVARRLNFGLADGRKETVLRFLVGNLGSDELESGALAKINTAVYRIHRDLTTGEIQQKLGIDLLSGYQGSPLR